MIPVKLKIKGLYSYQEKEQVIDFERLCEAQLFGIFGPVGSGKSSVLEAITYALYGETDRMNSREGRQYNMMNLNSSELEIDFHFKAGENDEDEYRFCVYAKRQQKNFDKIAKWERSAYRLIPQSQEWAPLDSLDGEKVLGLNYDNFRRTVIIPQGKFQEFLHLGGADRTRMLKELFDLHRFDLYYKVTPLAKATATELERKAGEVKGKEEVKPEDLEDLQAKVKESDQLLQQLKEKRKSSQAKVRKSEQLKVWGEELEQKQGSYSSLLLQKDEMQARQNRLDRYKKVHKHFDADLKKLKELNRQIQTRLQAYKDLSLQYRQTSKKLADAEIDFSQVQKAFEQGETRKARIQDLDKIIEIRESQEEAQKIIKQSAERREKLSQTEASLKEAQNAFEKRREELATLKAQIPDLSLLMQAQAWQQSHTELKNQAAELRIATEQLQTKKQEIQRTQAVQVQNQGLNPLLEIYPQIETALATQKKQRNSLQDQVQRLRVKQELAHFASNLHEGDACPLCGSTEHPHPLSAEQDFAELQPLQQQIVETEEHLAALQSLQISLKKDTESIQELEQELQKQSKNLRQVIEQLQQREENYPFEGQFPREKDEFAKVLLHAEQQQQSLKKQENQFHEGEKSLRELEKQKEAQKDALAEEERSLERLKTKAEILEKQLVHETLPPYLKPPLSQIIAKRDALEAQHQEIKSNYEKGQEKIKKLKNLKTKLDTERELEEREIGNLTDLHQDLLIRINEKVEMEGFPDRKTIIRILEEPLDVESEEKSLRDYQDRKKRLLEDIQRLEENLKDEKFDAEAHQKWVSELAELEKEIDKESKNNGALHSDLKRKTKILEERKKLGKEIERLEQRKANLDTLSSLFKGSAFVDYISTIYLQELCTRANERFKKLTRNKLSLEIDTSNNFIVRDFLNGGQVRSVKTLSGGQTFQAALSLALALADNVQQLIESSHNFFFLDEGFGTLDKDSLQIVFDTLKSLRKEKRIVGIISHVEELQQEIDTNLTLTLDEEKGSLIHASWEI